MSGNDRREEILRILSEGKSAVSGKELASRLDVSRQVIVQDIALLRANGEDIVSTNLGYMIPGTRYVSRVFKVQHTDEEVEKELSLIVDYGGIIQDVFVYHKVYGILRAEMNIYSRLDVKNFIGDLTSGKSSLLKNITSDYHYHTVMAKNEQTLDLIQESLQEQGYLAKLRDYEPIDFWRRDAL